MPGSLRRRKPDVGDIELLYIPVIEERKDDTGLFISQEVNLVDEKLGCLVAEEKLELRRNVLGRQVYGPKNKLMRHVPTGIPVDLFAATEENWWNYLVCRTGPAELNVRICEAAIIKGWKWNPYGIGFTRADGQVVHASNSEQEVFTFVGLPYAEPWERK